MHTASLSLSERPESLRGPETLDSDSGRPEAPLRRSETSTEEVSGLPESHWQGLPDSQAASLSGDSTILRERGLGLGLWGGNRPHRCHCTSTVAPVTES